MAYIESEKDVSDRLGMYFISVWEDCDTVVAAGIREFRRAMGKLHRTFKKKGPKKPFEGYFILMTNEKRISVLLENLS